MIRKEREKERQSKEQHIVMKKHESKKKRSMFDVTTPWGPVVTSHT